MHIVWRVTIITYIFIDYPISNSSYYRHADMPTNLKYKMYWKENVQTVLFWNKINKKMHYWNVMTDIWGSHSDDWTILS